MLGCLCFILFVCLLFGFRSYFTSHFRLLFGCTNSKQSATDVVEEEEEEEATDQSQRDDTDSEEGAVSEYQVFLSFRGPDSRQGFADVLYSDMISAGIRAFMDTDKLEIGEKIGKIISALEKSEICVPIFSRTFAASAWCLRELEAMVQSGKTIVPIFYTATPDDVKLSTGLFKKDLRKHVKKHGSEQVKRWENALRTVVRIKGREVTKNTRYTEFSRLFVRSLLIKLKVKKKYVTDCLVARDDQEQAIIKLLDIDTDDVRLVGIHGMGGIGKTTLAKVIFNQLSPIFHCCSFLENVQESLRRNGLDYLLKQLLKDLDPRSKHFQWLDYAIILKENFCNKRVLIVLDDVNKREEIEVIINTLRWFGHGSRIIITTRDKRVFTKGTVSFEIEEMNEDEALQLFSRHAFGDDSPPTDYRTLSHEVLQLSGRLPLALEVIGSRLYQSDEKVWKTTIQKLKKVSNPDIQKKLRISFDALEYEQKQIFLDISCFFINMEKASAICMWELCDIFPEDGIEVLKAMSLVKITWEGKFWMHDLIRDLGRELVREECISNPAKRSRIWSRKEALEILKIKQGKKKVEGLLLEGPGYGELTNEDFSSFRYLRLLKLSGTNLAGDFQDLLPKLMWFSWHRSPADLTVTNLSLKNLVVLDLTLSFINENWPGWNLLQIAKNLRVLNLTRCFNLTSTPDLTNNRDLERLILRGCINLAKMHSSILLLKRLKHLDLEGCYSLRWLPEEFGSLVDLAEILVEGSGNSFYLPESIGNLTSISVIRLRRVELTRIPYSIGGLVNLTCLSIENCTGVNQLPDTIGELRSLVELKLSRTMLHALPESISGLVKLQKLDLDYSNIEELPGTIGDLKALVELNLLQTKLSALPRSIGGLVKLQQLHLGSTNIEELPDTLGDLESLTYLDLSCTKVTVLPDSVGQLGKLEYLSLYSTWIEELPDAIGELKSLLSLNLSFTQKLNMLPNSVGRLVKLRNLSLELSKVEELPDSLGDLKSLEDLELSSSRLRVLPDFVGDMSRLKRLRLNRCKITELPSSIGKLTQLTELSAESCKLLTGIPKEIGNLPALRELRLTDSLVALPQLSPTVCGLSHLQELKIAISNDFSLENDVSQSTFHGLENLKDSVRLMMTIDCSCVKYIPQLPSTLLELELRHVGAETRLPDFSNLKNLKTIEFYYCSQNDELVSLQNLQTLRETILFSCTKELIMFSAQLKNLEELSIVEYSEEALDLPGLVNLTHLSVRDCRGLCSIQAVGNLESLYFFRITNCPSLEAVRNLSEMKSLRFVRVISCPKLEEIQGLDRLYVEDISIHHCGSLRNIEALKKRCQQGHFNGLDIENYPDKGEGSSGGVITRKSLEQFLKLSTEKRLKYETNAMNTVPTSSEASARTHQPRESFRLDNQEPATQQNQVSENLSSRVQKQFPSASSNSCSLDVEDRNTVSSHRCSACGSSTEIQAQLDEIRRHIAQLQQQQAAFQQQQVTSMSAFMQLLILIMQRAFPECSATVPAQPQPQPSFHLDGPGARLYQHQPENDNLGRNHQGI
ncbi:hypothetical protein SAY87_007402 [Trapa incisa]|uniref:TIR domain-containing protein n=1 Tax=Trapa incisa TaxID=236973 RepID=A0AAN7JYE1_9MYRT|nr:hypothetical protein SAY87_007402 [Trapa incisa]